MFSLLKLSLINLFYLLGGFIGFGLIFNHIEKINNSLIYSAFGKLGIVITGFIGTVVHELSHLIMCLIFGHKIVDVNFFRPIGIQTDGVLGYVNHSYNKNSLYHNIGNFFIGIAPLIGGTVVIILLFKLLIPNTYQNVISHISFNNYINYMGKFNIPSLINIFINDMLFVTKELLLTNIFNIRHLFFLFSVYSISTHMSLSTQDLKGSLSGLIVIFIVVIILTAITSMIGINMSFLSNILMKYNIFVILFMLIGLFFSLITLLLSYCFSIIF